MPYETLAMNGKKPGYIEQMLPIGVSLPVPSGTVSGDVIVMYDMVVFAQTDRDSNGYATCYIPSAFCEVITVYGRGNGVDSAVAIGDRLYFDDGDNQINKDASNGVPFGYALGTVSAGASDDVLVGFGL